MRNIHRLAAGVGGILGIIGLSNWSASAQAQAADQDNPAVVLNCNLTPDTNAGAKPPPPNITATPITPELLKSGQPCQQVVNIKGLADDTKDGGKMANLQRGSDQKENQHVGKQRCDVPKMLDVVGNAQRDPGALVVPQRDAAGDRRKDAGELEVIGGKICAVRADDRRWYLYPRVRAPAKHAGARKRLANIST